MKKTFNDVLNLLDADHYVIAKDPAFTVRRYLIQLPDESIVPIRYTPTMTEMHAEILKKGITKFIADHNATDDGSKAPKKLPKKKKAKADLKEEPRALKVRRELKEAKEKENAAAVGVPLNDIQASMQNEYTSNVVNILDVEHTKIDYDRKIPKLFDGYYFPSTINNMVTRISLGRNVFLQGVAGTGKSELVQKLAKFFGIKLMRINFNVGTTEQHLIGKFVVKDGQTQFVYGLIPLAMKNGWWILLDEIDYAQPEHLSSLQAVLEGSPLMITQNENEEILPHENFRIFATGNTKGRGDESQSYTGTNFLNIAFLDRWSIFEMDYTSAENKICSEYIDDKILVDQLTQYFKLLRKAADPRSGELSNVSFSTRRIIQICEVLSMGESLKDALTFELWSRYDEHEVEIMQELASDVWPKEHYLKGKWSMGMEHAIEVVAGDGEGDDAIISEGV